MLLDSKEGMQQLADFARAGRFVLNEWHEQTAQKYGVSLEGITISRAICAAGRQPRIVATCNRKEPPNAR